jgi:PIN domain nuclease of toxin-antitoxin system
MDGLAIDAIRFAAVADGVFVSPVSAWEIGRLSRPRWPGAAAPQFSPDPKAWFGRLMTRPGVRAAALTPDIAIDAAYLPGDLHRDPADRLLIATARDLGIPVVTRDRHILAYAAAGHVQAVGC